MAKVETFEDLEVWQRSRFVVNQIYQLTNTKPFAKDYSLCDQLRRCAISTMSNIAEGFEKASRREFAHYLDIAKGSNGEVRSQLYVARDLRYIDQKTFDELKSTLMSLSRQISSLMKYLKQNTQRKKI
jgi:four helix bundle protein